MTLIFDKNGVRDNRLNEYEQAIVKAGLSKAVAENDLERTIKEIAEIGGRKAVLLDEIINLEKVVHSWDIRRLEIQKEIAEAVQRGASDVAAMREKESESDAVIGDRKLELEKLNSYLVSLDEQIETKTENISKHQESMVTARNELAKVQGELSPAKCELEELKRDIQSLYKLKIEVTQKFTSIDVERQETEEIVKMLKENNKEGLELVASFEGERKRLQEKDEFLKRKEADILVYENRLKKHCEKAGYNVEMIFK